MGNETRRKNVITEFSNVYSTYRTSEMFGIGAEGELVGLISYYKSSG